MTKIKSTIVNSNNRRIRFQLGGSTPSDSMGNNLLNKYSPSTLMTLGNSAGTILSSLSNRYTNNPYAGEYANKYANWNQKDKLSNNISSALNVGASLDPTGTTALVNAGLNLGKGLGNLVRNEDQFGIAKNNTQEVIGNILDPIGRIQQINNTWKKHGAKAGLLDYATFGTYGNNLLKKDYESGLKRDKNNLMLNAQGINQSYKRNDSIYAQMGAYIKNKPSDANSSDEPNVEIENEEIYLGDPSKIKQFGNSSTSMESKFAAKFHGDQHGQDSDKDGMEGIPLKSEEGYVASNYLGIDGKKASSSNPSVSKLMEPSVKYLNKTEMKTMDNYVNNPIAIAHHQKMLMEMKGDAEKGKFMEELNKMLNKKDRDFNSILQYISEKAPVEDMSDDEVQLLNTTLDKLNQNQNVEENNMQPQNQMLDQMNQQPTQQVQETIPPEMMQQDTNQQMQMGGEVEQNESNNYAKQLMQQAQNPMNIQQDNLQFVNGSLNPQSMALLKQFPPEVQNEISKLPDDQNKEIAIQNYAYQMQNQQPQAQQVPQMEFGGDIKLGSMVTYKKGGKICNGQITGFNPISKKIIVKDV